ncbi:MAG: phenylacetate--CoA ligase family protein [Candidatus Brocadiia bacterium]
MKPAHLWAARALIGLSPPSPEKIHQIQERALRQLVQHAYHRVPFYRRLFDNHGISPKDIRKLEDLPRLPISSRKKLQNTSLSDRIADGIDPASLRRVKTSGSTGQPLTICKTSIEKRLFWCYWNRAFHHFGGSLTDRRTGISVPHHHHQRNLLKPLIKAMGIMRSEQINCCKPTKEIMAQLRRSEFDILVGMPGMIYHLADRTTKKDRQAIRPKYVELGGDTLTKPMRQRISKTFGAPVRLTYGSHELSLIAWECTETGKMHTCDDALIVEILKDGRPAKPGETGELVATNLISYAMPFIRYRQGDLVTQGSPKCPCGAPFGTIKKVKGRVVDYIKLPGGQMLHPFTIIGPVVYEAGWVAKYQIVQHSLNSVSILIRPLRQPRKNELETLERAVRKALQNKLRFKIKLVDKIAQIPGEKYRLVRSELTDGST